MTDIGVALTCSIGTVNYLTKSLESIAQSTMLGFGVIGIHTSWVLFFKADGLMQMGWYWYFLGVCGISQQAE
jgi:hypothetical protein